MNKNLFYKELKRNRKNLMIWSAIVLGFTLMVLSIYPMMADMGKEMEKMLAKMPAELGKAMGMDAETWSSILGFYSTYYGIYIVVLISIYTTTTGANIISKEERERTSEFLFTKPISRLKIFKTKMYVLFILALIIFIIQTIIAFISIQIFKTADFKISGLIIMHLNGFVLMLFFTSIGVLLSMLVQPKKNFMGMVVGLTFGSYFINAVSKSADGVSWLGYFSPFHYMDFGVLNPGYSFNWIAALFMLAVAGSLIVYSYKRFEAKDIAG